MSICVDIHMDSLSNKLTAVIGPDGAGNEQEVAPKDDSTDLGVFLPPPFPFSTLLRMTEPHGQNQPLKALSPPAQDLPGLLRHLCFQSAPLLPYSPSIL